MSIGTTNPRSETYTQPSGGYSFTKFEQAGTLVLRYPQTKLLRVKISDAAGQSAGANGASAVILKQIEDEKRDMKKKIKTVKGK